MRTAYRLRSAIFSPVVAAMVGMQSTENCGFWRSLGKSNWEAMEYEEARQSVVQIDIHRSRWSTATDSVSWYKVFHNRSVRQYPPRRRLLSHHT